MAEVKLDELVGAYEWVASGGDFGNQAVLDLATGRFYWYKGFECAYIDEEDLPDDIEEGDPYVQLPDQRDLVLGRPLVDRFVNEVIPEHEDKVAAIFSRKGAYGRYKDFLAGIGQLQAWYDFEAAATKRALLAWAEEQGIEVVEGEAEDDPNGTTN